MPYLKQPLTSPRLRAKAGAAGAPKPTPASTGPGKSGWSRRKFRDKLRTAPQYIPGTRIKHGFGKLERTRMEKDIFAFQKFGGRIEEKDVKRRLRGLRKEEFRAKTGAEKKGFLRQRRFLEGITGVKKY